MKKVLFLMVACSMLLGSCKKEVLGCTDSSAYNYNSRATEDDGSCQYSSTVYGCTNPNATNYNPYATVNDGSCQYASTTATIIFKSNSPSNPYYCYVDGVNIGTVSAQGTLSRSVQAGTSYSLKAVQASGYVLYASEYTATSGYTQAGYTYTWNIENAGNLPNGGENNIESTNKF